MINDRSLEVCRAGIGCLLVPLGERRPLEASWIGSDANPWSDLHPITHHGPIWLPAALRPVAAFGGAASSGAIGTIICALPAGRMYE